MADLPAEYAYTRPVAAPPVARPKIKIKVGGRGKAEAKPAQPPAVLPEPARAFLPAQPSPVTAPPIIAFTTKPKVGLPVTTPAPKPVARYQNGSSAAPATPIPALRKPPPAPSYATPIARAPAVPSPGLPRPGGAPIGNSSAKTIYSQPPNYAQLRPPPITYQQPQSIVSLVTSGLATPPIAPRSPSPELVPSTVIKKVAVIVSPSKRLIQLNGTAWGSDEMAPVRCFAVRLGRNETSLQLKVEAEKPTEGEEERVDGMEVDSKDENEVGVMVDGNKFPVEIKCNGTYLPPARKEGSSSAASTAINLRNESLEVDEDDDGDGEVEDDSPPKTNGHAGGDGEASDSENDSSRPAIRATRSGKVIPPPEKNGKLKRKRKSKRGSLMPSRVVVNLGQWDVNLNIGSNVLDIRAGGKDGESWRVFVDRVF